VGKSTVATNLALALRQHGATVGLLDADVYGPSVPTMLGEPDVPAGQQAGQRITPAVHYGIRVMSIGFFVEREGAVVWRGPMVHKLLQQFLEDVDWGQLDYLVVDLPPGTGDAQLSLTQLIPITGAVMVTTPQEVAIIDVIKAVSMFKKVEVPVLGIIENMSGYVCPACGHHDDIFARGGGRKLAGELGVTFLGELPIDARVRFGGDSGRPVVVGAPESEHAKLFLEIAARVATKIGAQAAVGPKRPAGLVQIR
jgi:ATP-binding protein involved in chromosome partitioning